MKEFKLLFASVLIAVSLMACIVSVIKAAKDLRPRQIAAKPQRSLPSTQSADADLGLIPIPTSADKFLDDALFTNQTADQLLGPEPRATSTGTKPDEISFEQATQPLSNGLPAGAWASRLQPIDGWPGLYRDPVTGKKYEMQNGGIVEETCIYAGLDAKTGLRMFQAEEQMRQRVAAAQAQDDIHEIAVEAQRANDIAEENASWQRFWEIQNRNSTPLYSIPPSRPVTIYGDSTRIGNMIFHDYYSSDGQQVHGDTTIIGNSVYTSLRGN